MRPVVKGMLVAVALAMAYALVAVALFGCGPSCRPHAPTVRLEPYEECVRATVEYCRRVVSPVQGCESILIDEFCTEVR